MIFDRKKTKTAAPGKKKIVRDQRNYHVTQISDDLAARERGRLESGIAVGGQVLSFKDGVLSVKKIIDAMCWFQQESAIVKSQRTHPGAGGHGRRTNFHGDGRQYVAGGAAGLARVKGAQELLWLPPKAPLAVPAPQPPVPARYRYFPDRQSAGFKKLRHSEGRQRPVWRYPIQPVFVYAINHIFRT